MDWLRRMTPPYDRPDLDQARRELSQSERLIRQADRSKQTLIAELHLFNSRAEQIRDERWTNDHQ